MKTNKFTVITERMKTRSKHCAYRGIMAGKVAGTAVTCPLCHITLVTERRHNRAYMPAHTPEKVSRGTQWHRAGSGVSAMIQEKL